MPDSKVVAELKKERLTGHLEQVENLISQWLGQLSDPGLFYDEVELFPQNIHVSTHQTLLEKDEEVNHQLRKHLQSRALWRHHAEWTRLQLALAKGANLLVEVGQGEMERLAQEEGFQPTLWFLNSALENALTDIVGGILSMETPESDLYRGVVYRGNKIETGALPEELEKVTKALQQLSFLLRKRPAMVELSDLWKEMKKNEKSMVKIGGDSLKASDIFYRCRFCKKLFK